MTTDEKTQAQAADESAPASLVDEYKLLTDSDGTYKAEILTKFNSYRQQLKATLQQGCKQEDYTLYNRLLESIDTAESVVERVWALAKEQQQLKGESDIFEEAIGQ
jgi:hypothetical protein